MAGRGGLLSSSQMLDAKAAIQPGEGQVHAALDAAVRGIAGLVSVDDVLQVIVDLSLIHI